MLKIGYLGPEGTYISYAAKLYDSENLKIPFNTINEVLNSLKDKLSCLFDALGPP